jgi:hypothetical protein
MKKSSPYIQNKSQAYLQKEEEHTPFLSGGGEFRHGSISHYPQKKNQ